MLPCAQMFVKNVLEEAIVLRGRHFSQRQGLQYRFRGHANKITAPSLHLAMLTRPLLFGNVLLTQREAVALACDDAPTVPISSISSMAPSASLALASREPSPEPED
jgi:hypothetical protein